MFLERLSESGIKGNKYYYDEKFVKGVNSGLGLPNCTLYSIGRLYEADNVSVAFKTFKNRTAGAFPNAKNFYDEWIFDKGEEPKVSGILVWGKSTDKYGHVGFVEEVEKLNNKQWKVKVSFSNYGGAFWVLKDYVVEKGKITSSVGYEYVGCVYNPYLNDIRVARNQDKNQVEVLADKLSCRESANGKKYEGLFVPKGLYNILETKVEGAYTWCKVEENYWFALNDKEAWTKTYKTESDSKVIELETQVASLKNENSKLTMKLARIGEVLNG